MVQRLFAFGMDGRFNERRQSRFDKPQQCHCLFDERRRCHFDERSNIISTNAAMSFRRASARRNLHPRRKAFPLRKISRFARNNSSASGFAATGAPVNDYPERLTLIKTESRVSGPPTLQTVSVSQTAVPGKVATLVAWSGALAASGFRCLRGQPCRGCDRLPVPAFLARHRRRRPHPR